MSQLHGHAGLKVFGLHANFFFFSFMPINISKYLYRKNSMQNCQITLSMGDLVVFFYAFLNYFFYIWNPGCKGKKRCRIFRKISTDCFKHIFQNLRVTKHVCMQTYLFSYLGFSRFFLIHHHHSEQFIQCQFSVSA